MHAWPCPCASTCVHVHACVPAHARVCMPLMCFMLQWVGLQPLVLLQSGLVHVCSPATAMLGLSCFKECTYSYTTQVRSHRCWTQVRRRSSRLQECTVTCSVCCSLFSCGVLPLLLLRCTTGHQSDETSSLLADSSALLGQCLVLSKAQLMALYCMTST
jgi:hypothetical protein